MAASALGCGRGVVTLGAALLLLLLLLSLPLSLPLPPLGSSAAFFLGGGPLEE
jgi:hypothetical protein